MSPAATVCCSEYFGSGFIRGVHGFTTQLARCYIHLPAGQGSVTQWQIKWAWSKGRASTPQELLGHLVHRIPSKACPSFCSLGSPA
ncbi:hypothetical protein EJB05_29711, partial [Eragrostis curvula]